MPAPACHAHRPCRPHARLPAPAAVHPRSIRARPRLSALRLLPSALRQRSVCPPSALRQRSVCPPSALRQHSVCRICSPSTLRLPRPLSGRTLSEPVRTPFTSVCLSAVPLPSATFRAPTAGWSTRFVHVEPRPYSPRRHATLSELAARAERWCNVDVRLAPNGCSPRVRHMCALRAHRADPRRKAAVRTHPAASGSNVPRETVEDDAWSDPSGRLTSSCAAESSRRAC